MEPIFFLTGARYYFDRPFGMKSTLRTKFKDNTWNVIIVISTQVIAQGYVSENKESRRTKYCKDTLYNNCFICNLSSYLAFAFRVVIDMESNKACIMPQLA